MFKHDLLNLSFIPSLETRQLRELSRYRYKMVCMRFSERNRFQNYMSVSNFTLARVLSDSFGKIAIRIMKEVLFSKTWSDELLKKLIHSSCKSKIDEIIKYLKGCHIESDQKLKMNLSFQHMEELLHIFNP